MSHSQPNIPPLIKEYSERMKIPLDTIRMLEAMKVLVRKPSLPIIIVLGEASAGINVTGTLVGLNLPTGLPFPIVLKFKNDSHVNVPTRKIWFEFMFEDIRYEKEVSETRLANKISKLMERVPEDKRPRIEITLTITQPHASDDLMVVLLPEIHTHHNKDEEKKEMELIQGYIEPYTRWYHCLFLNVLSCPSNFDSCLSRKVLKGLDYTGTHCITVFTKVDLSDEYLITHLTSKNVETPYFFVDNSTDEKTDERVLLSKVDSEYVGFDVVSKNLVAAMLSILFEDSSQILERLESVLKLKRCQKTFDSVSDAIPDIMSIVSSATFSIDKLFITGDYRGYEKDTYMHAGSNIALQFRRFKTDLHDLILDNKEPFLKYEIELLSSTSQYNPFIYVFSSSLLNTLLYRQVSYASSTIDEFVASIMDYIKGVLFKIFLNDEMYTWQLHPFIKKIGRVLVQGIEKSFKKKIEEMLDLEKELLYTFNDDFTRKLKEMESANLELDVGQEFTNIEGFGNNIRVDHLKGYPKRQIKVAFELKRQMVIYWEFVVNRFVDYCFLNLRSLIKKKRVVWIEEVMREHVMTRIGDKTKLPDVAPVVTFKKANLERRIEYLKKIKKDIQRWQVSSDV